MSKCDNCGTDKTATHEITFTAPETVLYEVTYADRQTNSSVVCADCLYEEFEYITDNLDPEAEVIPA